MDKFWDYFLLLVILFNHNVLAADSNMVENIKFNRPVLIQSNILRIILRAIRNICVIVFLIIYIPYVIIFLIVKKEKGQEVKLKKSTKIIGLVIVVATLMSSLLL